MNGWLRGILLCITGFLALFFGFGGAMTQSSGAMLIGMIFWGILGWLNLGWLNNDTRSLIHTRTTSDPPSPHQFSISTWIPGREVDDQSEVDRK